MKNNQMSTNNHTQRKIIFFIKSPVHDMMSKFDMTDNGKKLFGTEFIVLTSEPFGSIIKKISGSKEVGYIIDGGNKWENKLYNIYSNGKTFRFRSKL